MCELGSCVGEEGRSGWLMGEGVEDVERVEDGEGIAAIGCDRYVRRTQRIKRGERRGRARHVEGVMIMHE